jgi:hypothetical protein
VETMVTPEEAVNWNVTRKPMRVTASVRGRWPMASSALYTHFILNVVAKSCDNILSPRDGHGTSHGQWSTCDHHPAWHTTGLPDRNPSWSRILQTASREILCLEGDTGGTESKAECAGTGHLTSLQYDSGFELPHATTGQRRCVVMVSWSLMLPSKVTLT